jgi:hypothetical protein
VYTTYIIQIRYKFNIGASCNVPNTKEEKEIIYVEGFCEEAFLENQVLQGRGLYEVRYD